ncbi:uroporphyrinogen-III synthase [Altererythrobacter aquiaggeris]|uniref:uroporphyrinogen-III synthase n=1 Tax=Aestuarierythrobacter aquiaggeris TaxID=1898396 RepID=UPI003016E615
MKIVAIRPEPGSGETVIAASRLGLAIEAYPLFEIEPVGWDGPPPAGFGALLAGSANVFRHGGDQLRQYTGLEVLAVGAATADIAAAHGFTVRLAGEGGLQQLVDQLPAEPINLLRLAGENHISLEPPDHVHITRRIVYRSCARPMPHSLKDILRGKAMVLLHSAAAAQHFSNECRRLDIDPSHITLVALGPRIASAAGGGWAQVAVAARPSDAALLALARSMCHEPS